MKDAIPLRWVKKGPRNYFHGTALRNEYYVFQLGVFAHKERLNNVKIKFSNLTSPKDTILASALTSFNTEGTNTYGKHFKINVHVGKDSVQAFWIGVDVPKNITPGDYKGTVVVSPGNAAERKISINLAIKNKVLPDHGYDQPWRLSRLNWLNSTLGISATDQPTNPFTPVKVVGKRHYKIYGKQVDLARNGMPALIRAFGTDILQHPITYAVYSSSGKELFNNVNFKLKKRLRVR